MQQQHEADFAGLPQLPRWQQLLAALHRRGNDPAIGGLGNKGWNWTLRLLPFVESQNVFDQIDWTKNPYDRPATWVEANHAAMMADGSVQCNYKILRTIYPNFLCPSDSLSQEITGEKGWSETNGIQINSAWTLSQCDYVANIGDYRNSTGLGYGTNGGKNVPDSYTGAGNNVKEVRGVIGVGGWSASFDAIPDGLSNTFLFGECIGALSHWQNFGSQCFGNTAHPINSKNKWLIDNLPNSTGAPTIDGLIA